ncbi:carbohydrate ABC transporter permease [Paenibacillus aestuarii]|uniref:Sugar ABC transporter permease n=1 Tax=Paenibacillus aestuarii TaxID=516965 RepID=A0ABW0K328_9BACL|nr:sugar ABC transporter permease [Paenibacillus aestuarii]
MIVFKSKKRVSNDFFMAYLFLAPFLLFYLWFTFYPLLQGFFISFYEWNLTSDKVFVGLSNYTDLFQESNFWQSLMHTFLYVLISTPIYMAGAFILAVLVDHKFVRGRSFLRGIFFMPNVLAVSIISIIWVNMYQPYSGPVNGILRLIGFNGNYAWLSEGTLVWPAIILLTFWWNTGYYMILYLAGLQEVPEDRYEAAQLDGANWFQTLWYITIPSLKRIHILVLFLQVVASFKIFGQVFLTTEGGPGGASRTYIQFIYENGFQRFLMGKASAAAFVLFVIILVVSIMQLKLLKQTADE